METTDKLTREQVERFLQEIISKELKEDVESIGVDTNFFEFGFDSISSLYLLERIEKNYNIQLNQLYFWDYPTIRVFVKQLFDENKLP